MLAAILTKNSAQLVWRHRLAAEPSDNNDVVGGALKLVQSHLSARLFDMLYSMARLNDEVFLRCTIVHALSTVTESCATRQCNNALHIKYCARMCGCVDV